MSWYRQYRPATISGLHLQSVKAQLEKLRTAKAFPHALLLTGPRGAGKTSTARIIAAMLNDPANGSGPPYQEPDTNNDLVQRIALGRSLAVHELDAASNRGIDDIRALKEQAYLPPQEGQNLVFILDEVHMLTTEAFNALLKLLEEPPTHVIFILATTEEHKVPATIVSRSTVIRFSKATPDELKAALEPIIKDQQLKVDAAALDAIAEAADGSFRDAVKTLETVSAGSEKITLETVQTYLRTTPTTVIYDLLDAVIGKQEREVVEVVGRLRDQNTDQKQLLSAILHTLHQDLVASVTEPKSAKYAKRVSQFLLTQFSLPEVSQVSPIPLLGIELKALELVFRAQDKKAGGEGGKTTKPKVITSTQPEQNIEVSATPATSSSLDRVTTPTVVDRVGDPALSMLLIEKWSEFLVAVEQRNSSLAAMLRSGKASLTANGHVCVEVFYQFHRDQLKQPKFQTILEQACATLLGQSAFFEFQLAQSSHVADTLSTVAVPTGETDQLVQLAQEVFL